MIKEVKLKRTKKLKKNGKRRNNKKNKFSKKQSSFHNKKEYKIENKIESKIEDIFTEKLYDKIENKNIIKDRKHIKNKSIGGGTINNCKEKFEVKRLSDIDYSQFSLGKNADTDWGNSPGPPPTDCCLM